MQTDPHLLAELEFFKTHQSSFEEEYNQQFLLLKGKSVLGAFSDPESAYYAALDMNLNPGTFLIQKVSKEKDAIVEVFHSHVSFD